MKKLLLIAAFAAAAYFALSPGPRHPDAPGTPTPTVSTDVRPGSDVALETAYVQHLSKQQVSGQGTVAKTLSDDTQGSRHQRFIVRLDSGRTILVVHNIDLAPRIESLHAGDSVAFYGEYEWNPKGGVIHWTHHDPQGRHPAGWIKHNGQTYQ